MRHLSLSQHPTSADGPVLGISHEQLNTIDPIAPTSGDHARILAELERVDRLRAASLGGGVAFVNPDDLPPYLDLEDLVRGGARPDTNVLGQLINEIEHDAARFALRMWNLEMFARQLHDRVTRLENRTSLVGGALR